MTAIVMGAAGAGKSTVGTALAASLGWVFIEADDFHTAVNIERMRRGISLTDQERLPWLTRIRQAILEAQANGQSAIVACSALKRRYRQVLTAGVGEVRFVHLQADEELLKERLMTRRGHFAGPALAATQLHDLEVAEGEALMVDASLPPYVLVSEIRRLLGV